MLTFTGRCTKCGDDFTFQRHSPHGRPRLYCKECRPRNNRSILRRVEQHLVETKEALARVNAILDRIETRQGGTRS